MAAGALVFAAVVAPAPAQAQTNAELQTQIQALLAQIANLQAQMGGTATVGTSYNFTMNLTIGSRGADVTALQNFLIANGQSIPAGATGYFGAQTKAALAAYQAANGIAPAVGYFGPITRAKVNASATVTTPGTTPGTTPSDDLEGGAGSITVTQTSTDVEDEVLTGTTGKVLGFKVQAAGSDVKVSNVRVKFTAAVDATASDRLTSYADEIIIYADGKEVGSLDARDFVRDSAGVYSASIPVSKIVRMGSGNRVDFHVGLKAVSSIDSDDKGSTNDWTALFVSLRFEDATGVVLTDSTASISNAGIYVDRASSSSNVKLRMAAGSNNPTAQNVKVSTSVSSDVVLAEFTLKAEGEDMFFDQLRATTTVTGVSNVSTIASDFYLMRGSSRLAEVAATTGTSHALTFSLNDTEEISSGSTQTYKIVAKVKAITAGTASGDVFNQGDSITATTLVDVWNINAKADSDGKSVTERAGSVTTYAQALYSEGIQVEKVGESFTLLSNDTAANVEGEFKVTVRVTNFGSNDVYIPLNSLATTSASGGSTKGIAFGLTDTTTATSTGQAGTITGAVSRVSGGVVKTNSVLISGGQSTDIMLTTTFNPDAVYTGTRQYRVQIWSVGHATTDTATAGTIVDTTPVEDFRTSLHSIQN